jgi:hypothetical protein
VKVLLIDLGPGEFEYNKAAGAAKVVGDLVQAKTGFN